MERDTATAKYLTLDLSTRERDLLDYSKLKPPAYSTFIQSESNTLELKYKYKKR